MNDENAKNMDITIFGESSDWFTIAIDNLSKSELFQNTTACSAFVRYNIHHAGVMNAQVPFEIMRFHQSGTFFMACIEGEGEILIDGSWRKINSGDACLLPPYMINGLRAIQGVNWKFAWVRYREDENKKSIANSQAPTKNAFDTQSVVTVIEGLKNELTQNPHETVVSCWADLLHQQVLKFAKPKELDERISTIWEQVLNDIGKDWTLTGLAQLGFISEEHFRRLNNSQLGRSPMQHLIYMRMLHAKQLLLETDQTVESICQQVGYQNPFSFSNTFLKWMGCRPSDLRGNQKTY